MYNDNMIKIKKEKSKELKNGIDIWLKKGNEIKKYNVNESAYNLKYAKEKPKCQE